MSYPARAEGLVNSTLPINGLFQIRYQSRAKYSRRSVIVRLDIGWIVDWQVSLAYATTFLCILLLQYIFKLIPCSELSFRDPKLGWGFEITYSSKSKENLSVYSHINWRQGFVFTYAKAKKIPVDSDFNWRTRIQD